MYIDKQNKSNAPLSDENQTKELRRDNKFYLIILLIMLLVIAPVLVIMASSGLNDSSESISVNAPEAVLSDIQTAKKDLNEVVKSLDEINSEPDGSVVEAEAEELETVIVAPVVTEPKKSVAPKKVITQKKKPYSPKKNLTVIATSPVISDSNPASKENIIVEVEKIVAVEKVPDFIKHDNKGVSLADDTEKWTCVHNTTTGLMWEVKSKDETMRNLNNLYSWYNPEYKTLQGKPDGGRCKGGTDCDTNAYVQAMNESNYCGHNDWRLPTREQMQTLINLKNGKDKVKINKQYFPQTVPSWYWTSSDENNKEDYAWYVLFRNGFSLSDLKERPKHIRLVRDVVMVKI